MVSLKNKINFSLVFILLLSSLSITTALRNNGNSERVVTGEELKDLILNEDENIVVTLWYSNDKMDEEHNKRNLIIKGSLKRLISRCHPRVLYTEADLSEYNTQRQGFVKASEEWNLNLNELDEGPMVMVMYQQRGEMFWVTTNSLLIKLCRSLGFKHFLIFI